MSEPLTPSESAATFGAMLANELAQRDFEVLAAWASAPPRPLTLMELSVLSRRDPESIHLRDEVRRASADPLPPPFWRPQHATASVSGAGA